MESGERVAFYRVVVNREGCYCIWPTDVDVPRGWTSIGFSGPLGAALNQVAELWRNRGVSPTCDPRV
jgi:MbtH protein